jgi:hypothetical protein
MTKAVKPSTGFRAMSPYLTSIIIYPFGNTNIGPSLKSVFIYNRNLNVDSYGISSSVETKLSLYDGN